MQIDGWQTVSLGTVAEVALSSVDKRFESTEVPVSLCNYVDVYKNNRITGAIEFMQGSATPSEIDRFTLHKGDVLITKDSETPDDIGVPALVAENLTNTVCGYHLALLRSGKNVHPPYLFWQLQSESTKRHYLRTANGVTRFGLGIKAITGTPIPCVPQ
jgi:type I restriction enzyme S subunit